MVSLSSSVFPEVSYSFHRPFYERGGTYQIRKDGKSFIMVNMLGIDEKDIAVDVENSNVQGVQLLIVKGKTRNELFNEDFEVQWTGSSRTPIKQVTPTSKDGILTLEVEYEEPEKPATKINWRRLVQ